MNKYRLNTLFRIVANAVIPTYILFVPVAGLATFPPFQDKIHTGVLLDYTTLFSSYPIQNGWLDAMAATLEPASGSSDEKRLAGRASVFNLFSPDAFVRDGGYLGYVAPSNLVSGSNMFPRYMYIGRLGLDFNGTVTYSWGGNYWPLAGGQDSLWQANSGPTISILDYTTNILAPKLTLYASSEDHQMCGTWQSVPTKMINAAQPNDGRGVLVDASPAFDIANAKYIIHGYLSKRDDNIFPNSKCYTYFVTFYPENLDPNSYWWYHKEFLYVNNELKYASPPGLFSKTDTIDTLRNKYFSNTKLATQMRFDASKNCHVLNTSFTVYGPVTSLYYRVFNSIGSRLRTVTYSDLVNHAFFEAVPSTLDLRLINSNGTDIPTILTSAKNGIALCTISSTGALITGPEYYFDYIKTARAQFTDYTYSIDAGYANYDQYKHLNGNKYIICAISYPVGTTSNGVDVSNKLILVVTKYSTTPDNKLMLYAKVRYETVVDGAYTGIINECGKLISIDIKSNHLWITYTTPPPEHKYKYFHMDARAIIESIEQKNQ